MTEQVGLRHDVECWYEQAHEVFNFIQLFDFNTNFAYVTGFRAPTLRRSHGGWKCYSAYEWAAISSG